MLISSVIGRLFMTENAVGAAIRISPDNTRLPRTCARGLPAENARYLQVLSVPSRSLPIVATAHSGSGCGVQLRSDTVKPGTPS
jgi:hypothetical protein